MLRILLALIISIFWISDVFCAQSTITEADGYACMGEDKSRKQTEQAAATDAKRNAVEYAVTHLESESTVTDFELEKDLVSAYSKATVKILEVKESGWYKDERSGDCYKTKIKCEIVPDENVVKAITNKGGNYDDPSLPLHVTLSTDKKEYKAGEKIKIYLKGSKPFYARVLYKDTKGELLQLLPNPYRTDNYFNGGVVYEIPSGKDQFELEVSPPFGEEQLIVYASTSPLGDIRIKKEGGVYQVKTREEDIGVKTRGVQLKEKMAGDKDQASEFFEDQAKLKTGK
jgi:hypothetical protein